MYSNRNYFFVGVLSLILFTGCESSVKIIRPTDQSRVFLPLDLEVKFHQEADQSTFQYNLSLRDRRGRWQNVSYLTFPPTGNPRIARVPYSEPGNYKFKVDADFNPSYNYPYRNLSHTINFEVGIKQLKFHIQWSPPPGPPPSSFEGPATNGLSGSGSTGGPGFPGTVIPLGVSIPVRIYDDSPVAGDINITLTPINNPPTSNSSIININGQVNTPVTVKIIAGQAYTDFVVIGIQEGPVQIVAEARSHGYHDSILALYPTNN